MMTGFAIMSAALYCIAASLVVGTVVKLMTCCAHHYSDGERFGLGLMAGGMTMVIGSRLVPLVAVQLRNDLSPFNVWPGVIAAAGIWIYIRCDAENRTKREKLAGLSPFGIIRT